MVNGKLRDQMIVERELGHRRGDFELKKPYPTKAKAKAARRSSHFTNAGNMQAYICGVCDCWHIGNKPKPGRDYRERV